MTAKISKYLLLVFIPLTDPHQPECQPLKHTKYFSLADQIWSKTMAILWYAAFKGLPLSFNKRWYLCASVLLSKCPSPISFQYINVFLFPSFCGNLPLRRNIKTRNIILGKWCAAGAGAGASEWSAGWIFLRPSRLQLHHNNHWSVGWNLGKVDDETLYWCVFTSICAILWIKPRFFTL